MGPLDDKLMRSGSHAHVRVLVFDLDDTLYPERAYVFSGFAAVARAFVDQLAGTDEVGTPGVPADPCPPDLRPGADARGEHAAVSRSIALTRRMGELFETGDRNRVFDNLLKELHRKDAERLVPRMVDVFRSHRPTIELFQDADAALSRWRPRAKLGLISDGRVSQQLLKLGALGLDERLDVIVLTDRWGRRFWKPHRRAFEHLAEQLGVAHESCTYIADNPEKDFVAPNALGWRTIQIRRAGALYADLAAPQGGAAQAVVADLAEIDALFGWR